MAEQECHGMECLLEDGIRGGKAGGDVLEDGQEQADGRQVFADARPHLQEELAVVHALMDAQLRVDGDGGQRVDGSDERGVQLDGGDEREREGRPERAPQQPPLRSHDEPCSVSGRVSMPKSGCHRRRS